MFKCARKCYYFDVTEWNRLYFLSILSQDKRSIRGVLNMPKWVTDFNEQKLRALYKKNLIDYCIFCHLLKFSKHIFYNTSILKFQANNTAYLQVFEFFTKARGRPSQFELLLFSSCCSKILIFKTTKYYYLKSCLN